MADRAGIVVLRFNPSERNFSEVLAKLSEVFPDWVSVYAAIDAPAEQVNALVTRLETEAARPATVMTQDGHG